MRILKLGGGHKDWCNPEWRLGKLKEMRKTVDNAALKFPPLALHDVLNFNDFCSESVGSLLMNKEYIAFYRVERQPSKFGNFFCAKMIQT